MILAVAADKGSPGASTLATALALVWPGRRLLVETDPAGGTAGFRLHHRDTGELLQPDPSLAALAAAARLGCRQVDYPSSRSRPTSGSGSYRVL